MIIKAATSKDLETVLALIRCGREKMIASGNLHQWTDGHPSKAQIKKDIETNCSFLMYSQEGSLPIATFAFILGNDPTYRCIDGGAWINDAPYGTIHRVASAPGTKGIMERIVAYCFCLTDNIRIDTHRDNIPMQRALLRLGFRYCGIIYLEHGDERLAYQKVRE